MVSLEKQPPHLLFPSLLHIVIVPTRNYIVAIYFFVGLAGRLLLGPRSTVMCQIQNFKT